MLFHSVEFLFFFLPVTLIVFFLVGRRNTGLALAWLVATSLFFYGWWNPAFLALIGLSIIVNFLFGRLLSISTNELHRSVMLITAVTSNLGLIGFFKYAGFLAITSNALTGTDFRVTDILLPIGISFFTFQQIAYLVDVRRNLTAETNLMRYALFVSFFPQLIAGPIVHHSEILPQFHKSSTFLPRAQNISVGLTIFVIGLFKKVVLADNFASIASPVFAAAEAGEALSTISSLQGSLAYTFQLYFDFSGYSDMAIGLARLFSVRLPANFDSPYKATSIIDFWRRWHMTLSRFLRDYVYFPLGGSRKGRARRYANLVTTMLLGGLWHGASWSFVFWGGLHGAFLVINHAWRRLSPSRESTWLSVLVARSLTFFCIVLAWIFFRAETFSGALNLLDGFRHLPHELEAYAGILASPLSSAGFDFDGGATSARDIVTLAIFALVVLLLWVTPNTQEIMSRYRPALISGRHEIRKPSVEWAHFTSRYLVWRPTWKWSVALAAMAAASIMHIHRVHEFIYFQF